MIREFYLNQCQFQLAKEKKTKKFLEAWQKRRDDWEIRKEEFGQNMSRKKSSEKEENLGNLEKGHDQGIQEKGFASEEANEGSCWKHG